MIRRPPRSPLFPNTTRFGSRRSGDAALRPPAAGDRATAAARDRTGALDGGAPAAGGAVLAGARQADRKSTRLNSSHANISYAVFCLKKKKLTRLIIWASSYR